jgi:hypothetical protein
VSKETKGRNKKDYKVEDRLIRYKSIYESRLRNKNEKLEE